MKNTKLRKILSLVLTLFVIVSIPVGVYASDIIDNPNQDITPYGQICGSCNFGQLITSRQPTPNPVPYTERCVHKVYGHDNWKTQYYVTTVRCNNCAYLADQFSSSENIYVSCSGYGA